jgi:hypothetical protein
MKNRCVLHFMLKTRFCLLEIALVVYPFKRKKEILNLDDLM